MKKTTLILLTLFFLSGINAQIERQYFKQFQPIKYEENILLKGFDIQKTYRINEQNFILFGFSKTNNTGWKILHLQKESDRYAVKFESKGAYDSYSYEASFYQNHQDSIVILCNMGTEFDWGTDAYLLTQDSLKMLGNLNASANVDKEGNPSSIVPFLEIYEEEGLLYFEVVNKESEDLEVYLFMDTEQERKSHNRIRFYFSEDGKLKIIDK